MPYGYSYSATIYWFRFCGVTFSNVEHNRHAKTTIWTRLLFQLYRWPKCNAGKRCMTTVLQKPVKTYKRKEKTKATKKIVVRKMIKANANNAQSHLSNCHYDDEYNGTKVCDCVKYKQLSDCRRYRQNYTVNHKLGVLK